MGEEEPLDRPRLLRRPVDGEDRALADHGDAVDRPLLETKRRGQVRGEEAPRGDE
jgi:hypothetical protein